MCAPTHTVCGNLTVSEVKVRQIPPKPLKETARNMRADSTDGTHGNEEYQKKNENIKGAFNFFQKMVVFCPSLPAENQI